MKKSIIVLGILLTSGIAAFALSGSKSQANETSTQVKSDRVILEKNQNRAGNFQSDIATAD